MNKPDYSSWLQQDGTRVPINAMSTGHILNCIRMLERNHNPTKRQRKYKRAFLEELEYRKDDEDEY